jgi:TPR repeat protein
MYFKREGVLQDLIEAVKWYRLAANQIGNGMQMHRTTSV